MSTRSWLRGPGLAALIALAWPVRLYAAQPVGSEFQVNTYTTDEQDYPAVASDADGAFVVVWESWQQDGDDDGVFGQRYDASGSPLGGEFQVNAFTTGGQGMPDVAADADGNFVVVWERYPQPGSTSGIFGRRYDVSGGPIGGEFQVNTYSTNRKRHPEVASDADGNFVVVWDSYGQDGSAYGIFGQRYDASGSPLGNEFQINTHTGNNQWFSRVASDAQGNFVVVWASRNQDGSGYGVFGQHFDASGNPLGSEFQVNTYTTSDQWFSDVASDREGNFVVAWASYGQDGSYAGVFGQRYDAAADPLGGEFQVNTFTNYTQRWPVVATDAEGDFIVAWESPLQAGIIGQEYASDGTPRGGEFQVNTSTNRAHRHPTVASDADGVFVVAFESYAQDHSRWGIFGQRFAASVLRLSVGDGACPGVVQVAISNAPPNSEVAIVSAANNSGFVKRGTLCNGTLLEIGEPFALPPVFVAVDEEGGGSALLSLQANRCWVQALALEGCTPSNALGVPQMPGLP